MTGPDGQNNPKEATQPFETAAAKNQAVYTPELHKPKPSSYNARSHSMMTTTRSTTTSEETRYRSRKRKSSSSGSAESSSRSSASPDTSSDSMVASSGARQRSMAMLPKKTAHSTVEKRYRTNLNDGIAALRDSVPSLLVKARRLEQQSSEDGDEEMEREDLESLAPAHKLNKATILSKATEYITHLERQNANLAEENATLRSRVEGLQMMNRKEGVDEKDEDRGYSPL